MKMMRMKKLKVLAWTMNINKDTARTEKFLRLYFHSLAKSGTIRTVEEEFNLVTAKLGQVFKCQKFIISDKDLSEQGLIAQIMFQEMEVPEKFRDVWWEEMKSHVHKKWMSGNQTVALLSKKVFLVSRNACF